MSAANVVDSSGWLEYFTDSERAPLFAPAIEDVENLFVPVISIYEVFKKVLRERGEDEALQIASVRQNGQLINLDCALALEAARHSLPLADSIIYAAAMRCDATLWTQDEHFKDLPNVRFFPKDPANKPTWSRWIPRFFLPGAHFNFSGFSPFKSFGTKRPSLRITSPSKRTSPPPHSLRWMSTMSQCTALRLPLSATS